MNFLGQNVAPGLLPARQAYLSVTELESRISAGLNAYDQYEVGRRHDRDAEVSRFEVALPFCCSYTGDSWQQPSRSHS
jgi:hypothetical protein